VRSSAAGVIKVVLKKCGPGSLSVKTTPAYAKEFKRALNSTSSLTVRLSPDRKGRALLRRKKHPHVSIQLTLIATSGPQPGLVVTHTSTVTIGVNGSRGAEEKRAAGHQAEEEATAAQEAQAAAKKKAEEEAAAKKKTEEAAAAKKKAEEEAAAAAKKKAEEVAAHKAAAAADEAEATADKKAAATDESEAPQLLGESMERNREAESYAERSGGNRIRSRRC